MLALLFCLAAPTMSFQLNDISKLCSVGEESNIIVDKGCQRAGCEADASSFVEDRKTFRPLSASESTSDGHSTFAESNGHILLMPEALPATGTVVAELSALVAEDQRRAALCCFLTSRSFLSRSQAVLRQTWK
jgi:hypothetical protein